MGELARLAFTIGYIGKHFHGSQIQPDVKTVQGELIRVFKKLKWINEEDNSQILVLSSRTDAGVNVRLNGGVVVLDKSLWKSLTPRKMIRAVDDHLCEGLVFLSVKEVSEQWNPRLAEYRKYRYRLEGIQGWKYPGPELFSKWLSAFVGTYDARNFARLEEGKNPIRKIFSCEPWIVNSRVIGFEIVGEAFLWNQVRRTAMALYKLSIGDITLQQVELAISDPITQVDFGVAPPDWLILWEVSWPSIDVPDEPILDFDFTPFPEHDYAERTMFGRWEMGAKLEIESLLYHQWSVIGALPYSSHR
tara:strand:+ start:216 stop:1127 length:912 start_codon:yes stop_codon:yes gene_type:complete